MTTSVALPPGQHRVDGFPRFGTHLHHPPPPVPVGHRLVVTGADGTTLSLSMDELAALPRVSYSADFHCVAGWSATDLHWEGVSFATLYRTVLSPVLADGAVTSHVVFGGLDGYESVVCIDDALRDDFLLADTLNGMPLDADHGAPLRVVSPSQYGFISTKHLSCIALHTRVPVARQSLADRVLAAHPRARVWREERHGRLPAWAVRDVYRLLVPPIRALCARGTRTPRQAR
jgi:DMSO/TMAO reductase YedYZ molybdopterin-dependent catalytic subunit